MAFDFFKARADRRRSQTATRRADARPLEAVKGQAIGELSSKAEFEPRAEEEASENRHDLETFTFPFHNSHPEATTQLPASTNLRVGTLATAPANVIAEPRLTLRPQQQQQIPPSLGLLNGSRVSIGSDLIDYFKLNAQFDVANNTTIETVQTSDRSRGLRQVTVVKKWRRVKRIGQGACGAVWLESDDAPIENHRAVKEITKDLHSSTLKVNYTRELLALGRLSKVCRLRMCYRRMFPGLMYIFSIRTSLSISMAGTTTMLPSSLPWNTSSMVI